MSNYPPARTWEGDKDALEAFTWIEPTGFTSPKLTDKKRKRINDDPNIDRIRIYFEDRGYGFTQNDVYFHVADIVKGIPREGAAISYTTNETAKGFRASNVYIGDYATNVGGAP